MNRLRRVAMMATPVICALAAAGPAHAAAPGVNVSGYADAPLALDQGAKQVRFFVRWSDFEPSGPNDFNDASGAAQSTPITQGLEVNVGRVLAAGATPIMTIIGTPAWAAAGKRPRNPDEYATFVGELARYLARRRLAGAPSPVYEIWNEPDAPEFWGEAPDADFYTAMLKASYAKVKAADPGATVLTGPTTGNNFDWIEALYARGAKGSFDGVSVHTDTACSVVGPDVFYRGPDGRIGQFTFLGYREVRATMLAHGDDKPIWMSELGWSTTNGGPTSCTRGSSAGAKPSGVDEATQAAYMLKAQQCLAQDPYVVAATYFTLRDDAGQPADSELAHYGLLRRDGSAKPGLDAFRAAGSQAAGPCGDFEAPSLDIVRPAEGQQFVDKLDLAAAAADGGVGLARITYTYDGGQSIRNFTGDTLVNGGAVGLAPWYSSGSLSMGPHTIEVSALDKNGNTVRKSVRVTKVAPGSIAATLKAPFSLAKKVTCKKRVCTLKGKLVRPAGGPSISGKVAVAWEFKNAKGKFRKLIGGLKSPSRTFTFKTAKLRKGSWRVRVAYQGVAPYKSVTSKYLSFRVK